MPVPSTASPPTGQGHPPAQPLQITPELVQKVAAKVYALMLAEIKIEHERRPQSAQDRRALTKGGRHAI